MRADIHIEAAVNAIKKVKTQGIFMLYRGDSHSITLVLASPLNPISTPSLLRASALMESMHYDVIKHDIKR